MPHARAKPTLLPRPVFLRRLLWSGLLAAALLALSLGIGVLGYHLLGRLDWIDSLYNAAMILAGMGPADTLPTPAAKVFASIYALFSGAVFLTSVGVVMAPVVHRFLHHFHFEDDDKPSP